MLTSQIILRAHDYIRIATPVAESEFEVQMLATDATGNTGITGTKTIGIHTVQLYG